MKKLLFALTLLAGSAFGQTAVINNFTALIKGVTIGPNYCYFWAQSPGPSQIQIACASTPWPASTLLKNTIQTITASPGGIVEAPCVGFGATPSSPPTSMVCWLFKPNATPPGIDYQITGLGTTGGNATITGTF